MMKKNLVLKYYLKINSKTGRLQFFEIEFVSLIKN